jgi:tetratricopeptide (TPR) repeat protein
MKEYRVIISPMKTFFAVKSILPAAPTRPQGNSRLSRAKLRRSLEGRLVFARSNSGAEQDPAGGPPFDRPPNREQGRNAARFVLTVIGTFGTLAAFTSTLGKESLRHWIQVHPYLFFIAFVAELLLILAMGNYAHALAKRYRELDRATRAREVARNRSANADALLELLAFFGRDAVGQAMLQSGNVRAPTEALDRLLNDPDLLRRAASELLRLSLAEVDPVDGKILLRRIAQETTRGQLSIENPDAARALRELVQSLLAASDPGTPDRDDAEGAYRQSRRHLVASGSTRSPDPSVRRLVINQVRRLYRAGNDAEGGALGELSLGHWQEEFGSDDRQTLALAVETGSALRRLGRWKEAMDLNLDTLGRLRSVAGTGDKVYLLCAKSCGLDLALLGDYAAALEHDLRLVPSFEQAFGRGHLETLQLRNEIAISLRCLGRFEEALTYDRQTCAERQAILGPEDTGTLTSRFAIARDLRMLGRVGEAHEVLAGVSSVLARRKGASRQLLLVVEADLAVSLRRCGRYPEALTRAEEAFRQHEAAFGPGHRETLRAGISVVSDLGRRLVAGWTAAVGADHPNTLAAQSALASVLRAQGNPLESLRTDEHVAAKFTGLLGEAHPSTLTVLTNTASDLAMMGAIRDARQAGERSLRLHNRTLGREHPHTLATAANLSLDRRADGDPSGADKLRASTLRHMHRALGPGHPDSQRIAQYGRMTLDIEPMMD